MSVSPELMGLAPPGSVNPQMAGAVGQDPGQLGTAGPPMPPGPPGAPPGGPPMPPGMPGPPMGQPDMPPPPPKKKKPTLVPTHLAREIATQLNKTKTEVAKGLVGRMGTPRGSVDQKPAELLKIWRKRNKDVDVVALFLEGVPADEIEQRTYPLRDPLIKYGRRTWTERVEFAEYMNKLDRDPNFVDVSSEDDDPDDLPTADFPSEGLLEGEE